MEITATMRHVYLQKHTPTYSVGMITYVVKELPTGILTVQHNVTYVVTELFKFTYNIQNLTYEFTYKLNQLFTILLTNL